MGVFEEAYQSTHRQEDEKLLVAALGSMDLRLDVREACLAHDPAMFFNRTYGNIWAAAKKLASEDRLMLPSNFRPLLSDTELERLDSLHGRPVRKVEFDVALKLVGEAFKRRKLVDVWKRAAFRLMNDELYAPTLTYTHEQLAELESAEVDNGSADLRDVFEVFWEQVENPGEARRRFETCWPSLDRPYLRGGIMPGQLVVCMAPSGGGKSVLLLQLADKWARDKLSLAIFSLEMDRLDVADRILSSASGVNIGRINERQLEAGDEDKLIQATDAFADTKVRVFDAADMTLAEMRQQCAILKRTIGLDAVFIDYAQIIPSDLDGESRERQVSEMVRQMKAMAMSLDVVVLTASQMSGDTGQPDKNSTRESKAIVHHSDLVLALKHTSPGEVDLVVVKNRRGPESQGLLMYWHPQKNMVEDPTK